jgi:SAM-dependent methyltransferase
MDIPDQQQMWNRKHGAGEHADFRGEPVPFAREVGSILKPESYILELGCGVGRDAYYFAGLGHRVLATDFSQEVIIQDRELLELQGLEFVVADITLPIDFPDEHFDAVYANLSLHYYDHETTTKIFVEIARVLKVGGLFTFACRTPKDPDYADGEEVSPGLFVSQKGHVRHFFTPDYARQLTEGLFEIKSLKEVEECYVNKTSHFVHCIAAKSESVRG